MTIGAVLIPSVLLYGVARGLEAIQEIETRHRSRLAEARYREAVADMEETRREILNQLWKSSKENGVEIPKEVLEKVADRATLPVEDLRRSSLVEKVTIGVSA